MPRRIVQRGGAQGEGKHVLQVGYELGCHCTAEALDAAMALEIVIQVFNHHSQVLKSFKALIIRTQLLFDRRYVLSRMVIIWSLAAYNHGLHVLFVTAWLDNDV